MKLTDNLHGFSEKELLDKYVSDDLTLQKIYDNSVKYQMKSGIKYVINKGLNLTNQQLIYAYLFMNDIDSLKQLKFDIFNREYMLLYTACASIYTNFETIKYIIDNIKPYCFEMEIHNEMMNGNEDIVKYLYDKTVLPNEIDYDEELIESLIEYNRCNMIKIAIKHGLKITDEMMYEALNATNYEITKLFLENNGNINNFEYFECVFEDCDKNLLTLILEYANNETKNQILKYHGNKLK